jgi:Spy/CpxP family protein refolding chaperone
MHRWIRRTLLGVFGASIAVGALTGCGHYGARHGWESMSAEDQARTRERMMDRVARRLELDEEQKSKLGVVADRLMEQRTALRAGKDPRTELQSLVSGERFDRAKAQALITEKTAAVAARSPEVIAAFGDFYDSLRPTQQARVREFLQRRGRHGWMRG